MGFLVMVSCVFVFLNQQPLFAAQEIAVDPTVQNYGDVTVGTGVSQSFIISNVGTTNLQLKGTVLTGTHAGEFNIESGKVEVVPPWVTLAPFETHVVVVSFNPQTEEDNKSAVLQIYSDDPITGVFDVGLSGNGVAQAEADIAVDPVSHDYGDVTVSGSASQSFLISNLGTAALQVTGTILIGTHAAEFNIESGNVSTPITILPFETHPVPVVVSFNPLSVGAKSAALSLTSTDPDGPLDVPLTGNAVPTPVPDIAVNPAIFDYGDVKEGTSTSQIFVVRNDGLANLVVTNITISGTDEFAIVPVTLPFTLTPTPPNNTKDIQVNFKPTSTGAKSATLSFASNDPDENPLDVPLDGFGVSENLASTPITEGYRDFAYGSQVYEMPTAEKPETKLWWNDDKWWGCLWDPVAQTYRIHRFDDGNQKWVNTGPDVDSRTASVADALWDEANQKLYIVSHIHKDAGNGPAFLYRYTYNSGSYNPDTADGFPVQVVNNASETVTLAKDLTGKLWITYVRSKKVRVNCTDGDDTNWIGPFVLPVDPNSIGVSNDDISAIIAFGGGKIGVMWSNKEKAKTYFAWHDDNEADPQAGWILEVVLEDPGGDIISDDHINLKAFEGVVYAVTKTLFKDIGSDRIYVLKRDTNGSWSKAVFGKKEDGHTRPILLIDKENRQLYVFAKSDEEGHFDKIYVKSAPLDNISFAAGVGDVFIQPDADSKINNPSSTKQNLDSTTGLLVIADEKESRYYFHNTVTILPAPDIAIDIVSYDYQDVPVGSSAQKKFKITNEGEGNLEVASSTLISGDVGEFQIVSGGGAFTLGFGQSKDVVVRFQPTSEGAKGTTLRINSNDPDEDPLDVPLTGTGISSDISVTPPGNYGNVMLGSSKSITFEIKNADDATGDLELTATTLDGDADFDIVSGNISTPVTLGKGETWNIGVSFTPSATGLKAATLKISNNDPAVGGSFDVPLSGTGTTPEISVSPSDWNYGNVVVNTSSPRTFTVANALTASADLELTSTTLNGDPDFKIVSGNVSAPVTLTPGETWDIVVSFTPDSMGAKSATLSVASNDLGGPLNVDLDGKGVDPTDVDDDGLTDSWELQIIYADPNDNIKTIEDVQPDDDYDGDGLSNLEEFESGGDPTVADYETYLVKQFVTRFYQLCLDRDPDAAGLEAWTNNLLNLIQTGADVAEGFIYSPEFVAKNTNNEEYLTILYKAFFDRDPDPGGWDLWLAELDAGRDRGEVLNGFIYSQEFADLAYRFGITPY